MQLIEEIEISYFRSFYKLKLKDLRDLNVIYGKNDSGKSNIVRALNLFFSQRTDHNQLFEFSVDFCEKRMQESLTSGAVRKFLYVKITFNTPSSYQASLGRQFYVKRQWTISRGSDYHEVISSSIPKKRLHLATRFINRIKFIYIPAIKDIKIFEMLLTGIHETVASSGAFVNAVKEFSSRLQESTSELFDGLPKEVSSSTKIGPPNQLSELFRTLDFETIAEGDITPKSLTRQRGDGIKVRHIPELLNFISSKDNYDYHIWGFEEPENSLDFVAAQSEAKRLLAIAETDSVQIFLTTHSPSFYLLENESTAKFYVGKDRDGLSEVRQGREIEELDAQTALQDGFYLPAVAEAVKNLASVEARAREAELKVEALKTRVAAVERPVVLTEGRTDAKILLTAWEKRRGGTPPFSILSCDTDVEQIGPGSAGAQNLAIRLRGIPSDHPHPVIGIFDYDKEGIESYRLDRNFEEITVHGRAIKRSRNTRVYAACLPSPSFRLDCEECNNLPIEFMFRDEHLAVEVGGNRLELTPLFASRTLGKRKVECKLGETTNFKEVGNGKKEFANVIVPTLPEEAFDAFDILFELIEKIISESDIEKLVG